MCGAYQPSTVDRVAQALCRKHFLTPREIGARIELHLARSTVRAALQKLVQDGAVDVAGDITQKRYRRRDGGQLTDCQRPEGER